MDTHDVFMQSYGRILALNICYKNILCLKRPKRLKKMSGLAHTLRIPRCNVFIVMATDVILKGYLVNVESVNAKKNSTKTW